MKFNESVGMTFDECYKKYKGVISQVARKNMYRVKSIGAFNYEDIYQIAMIGFIKAYAEFNDSYKTKFKPYAYDMMKWEILNTLKSKRTLVSFPQSFFVIWSIASKKGISSRSTDKMMKYKPAHISEQQLKRAMEWYGNENPSSLDKQVESDKGNDNSYYDTIVGSYNDESVVIVNEFIDTLTTKQKQVVKYLLEGRKQTEIAKLMGISQPQVCRIVKSLQNAWINMYGSDE